MAKTPKTDSEDTEHIEGKVVEGPRGKAKVQAPGAFGADWASIHAYCEACIEDQSKRPGPGSARLDRAAKAVSSKVFAGVALRDDHFPDGIARAAKPVILFVLRLVLAKYIDFVYANRGA